MADLDDIYAFSSQSDIDRIGVSVKTTEGINNVGGTSNGGFNVNATFAKITALRASTGGKQATGIEYIYDSDTWTKIEDTSPTVYDDDDSTSLKSGDIYSDTAMKVGDIVEITPYVDKALKVNQADNMQWLARIGGGGAERPVIMAAGDEFTYGAIITSPTDETATTEFEASDGITFKTLLPWGAVADVPDDFKFVGDLVGTTYYTESYPKTIWCRPNETYPTSGGITNFDLLDSKSQTATEFATPVGAELILDDFDNINASTQSRGYFSGKLFACSYNFNDGNFYLDFPLIGN